MGPVVLRLCRVMKNALLRRKTRRPHNQPSSATTWQSTWLPLAVVAIVLCELLNRQEFITHRHLSDIGDWIVQAVVHAIVNGGTWTVVQLRKYTAFVAGQPPLGRPPPPPRPLRVSPEN